jgi:dTDP-4-dehydrorhamnose reductase
VGISDLKGCHQDPEKAEGLNSSNLLFLMENCHRFKSRLFYLSSSFVFSGKRKTYGEEDLPDFSTHLGRTKSSAENVIEKNSMDYVILRCCQLYGRNLLPFRENFFEKTEKSLACAKELLLDNSIKLGFLDVSYLGMIMAKMMEQDMRNLRLHVSSRDALTHFEFAQLHANVFGMDSALVGHSILKIPFLPGYMGEKGASLEFRLKIGNLENYLNLILPQIEDSLGYSKRRFNGRNS